MNIKNQKIIYIIILLLSFSGSGFSQSINDKVFKDVICIESKDLARLNNNILIHKLLKTDDGHIPVFYNNAQIPDPLFFNSPSFYPELSEFIIISPDWQYYRSVAKSAKKSGLICAEPITTSKIFHIKRMENKVMVDSIKVQGSHHPEVNFSKAFTLPEDSIAVYFTDCYGSVCCPRDPKWDLKINDKQFIAQFEKLQHVKTGNTYHQITGKEGEHCTYYTLDGLKPLLKLRFILDKQRSLYIGKTKYKQGVPQIYTPQLISKKRLSLQTK